MESVQQQQSVAIPEDIGTPRAKLVYFALAVHDGATVAELQELLSMQKLTLLSILDSLSKRELIREAGAEYRPQGTATRASAD